MEQIIKKEVVIIGGGPAGLAAAQRLWELGTDDVLLIEREKRLGGILNQCIHDGFGLIKFGKSMTGPEYAIKYIKQVEKTKTQILLNATVVDLSPNKIITVVCSQGYLKISAKTIILSMGCRERTRGALEIPGSRPAGIYTAGVAQNFVNVQNIMVGKNIVILGSGDIGLIMARRLTLEGSKVLAVVEKMPYTSGLPRNIRQCIEDYDIPLFLRHTVSKIEGRERVEAVTVTKLDSNGRLIKKESKRIECDTVILSVGLIPENELSTSAGIKLCSITGGPIVDNTYQTNVEGVFACGNVLHVHDLVDNVSEEGEKAAESVVSYIKNELNSKSQISVKSEDGIRYILPSSLNGENNVTLKLRVDRPYIDARISLHDQDNTKIKEMKFKKLLPSEMICLNLKKYELQKFKNELKIRVS